MDFEIECLKCGSYIHDTDHCRNWNERRWCITDHQYKESCECKDCANRDICKYCNFWKKDCDCNIGHCLICNEHVQNHEGFLICYWNHNVEPCKFCKLPISKITNTCLNKHYIGDPLCKVCDMPKGLIAHLHDNSTCKMCGTLLNYGSCIYMCVNAGNKCVYCYCENIVGNKCRRCYRVQIVS